MTSSLKVLFIGGTGTISSACVARAVEQGFDVTVLNRGSSSLRPVPAGVQVIHADVRNSAAARAALGSREFDAVAEFVAFAPAHVETDLDLFRGRTGQYVFISSTVVYQMPPRRLPIVESSLQRNPYWDYAEGKIGCEEVLTRAFRDEGFPVTIVRPSYTYDWPLVPCGLPPIGWTLIDRMRRGRPIVVHGDGTSLWVFTHCRDFAMGFVGLLANQRAIGESFHITSDEVLSWNQVYEVLGAAAGATPEIVHVTSETIASFAPDLGKYLFGHVAYSMIYDNSKIKAFVPDYRATVPLAVGASEVIDWYDANLDSEFAAISEAGNATLDRLVELAKASRSPDGGRPVL